MKKEKSYRKIQSTCRQILVISTIAKNHKIKFSLIDRLLTKKAVSEIIDIVYRYCGQKETVIFCDRIKDLGFKYAFKAGISFGKNDLIIPKTKKN
jgi:DNA-directed RNA polymerase subunit beta'